MAKDIVMAGRQTPEPRRVSARRSLPACNGAGRLRQPTARSSRLGVWAEIRDLPSSGGGEKSGCHRTSRIPLARA
jgi:hypothetical protein